MLTTKNHKSLRLCVTLLMLGCIIFGAVLPVSAASYPKPDNKIADEANVLSESTIRSIKKQNEELAADVGATIAVCTVKTTGNTQIDEYARGLFKDWKLGEGVLLLIAADDNNYYFVQSVGVDKIITNEALTAVRNDYLEADFAAGNIDRGVNKTVSRLSTLLVAGLEDAAANTDENEENSDSNQSEKNEGTTFGSVIVGIFKFLLVLVLIVIVLFAALFVAALANDDCAEIFSNIWQNFILRKGKKNKTYSMPDEYYDERLYGKRQQNRSGNGNRPQNGQRRPNPNNPNANRQTNYRQQMNRPQNQQIGQPNYPRLTAGQNQNRQQYNQYNGQAQRNQYYNADGTLRQPRQNPNAQNNANRQNDYSRQNTGNQYNNAQFGDETRQFIIPGRGQNQR